MSKRTCPICGGSGHGYKLCPEPLRSPRSEQRGGEAYAAYAKRLRYNEYQRLWQARNISAVPERRDARNKRVRERHAVDPSKGRARGSRHHSAARVKLHEAKDAPCTDCGNRFPPECMDFDHLPGTEKLFGIGQSVRRAWAVIEAEIAKCELVCANCHRTRTVTRKRAS